MRSHLASSPLTRIELCQRHFYLDIIMITPLQDYIVVKPVQRMRSEILTVITSETDQGSWGAYADVIAVGPGLPNKKGKIMPLDAKIGDRVMYGGDRLGCINFPKYVEDGVEYRLIQEADICFVEESKC